MTQNHLKRVETSQNQVKMTQKDSKMTQSYSKFQNGENLELSSSFHFSIFEPTCPNMGILG